MGKSGSKERERARDESGAFLKKPPAPKIVITASSDDSPDLDMDHNKRFNDVAGPGRSRERKSTAQLRQRVQSEASRSKKKDGRDMVQSAPPEGDPMVSERQAHKNWLLALLLLLIYIALVVMTGQLTRIAFEKNVHKYKAPFLFVWCKVTLRILAFPSVLAITLLIRTCKRQPLALHAIWRHCTKTLRNASGQITVFQVLRKFFPMSITMLLMQIGWVVGMVYAPTSIVAALCSGAVAFSYLLSWLVLKNKMLLVKGLFVIVAFVGIGLIGYETSATSKCDVVILNVTSAEELLLPNTTTSAPVTIPAGVVPPAVVPAPQTPGCAASSQLYLGVVFGLGAAIFYSLHQLAFKLAYPVADLIQVSFIMSCMSLMISLMYLPVPLTMHLTKYEEWRWDHMPITISFIAWCGSYVSSISYAYGLALSTPFFMSVSEVLIVALNTGIDTMVHMVEMKVLQIIGTALVVLAFFFMVMPDSWLSIRLRGAKERPPAAAELQALRPLPDKD